MMTTKKPYPGLTRVHSVKEKPGPDIPYKDRPAVLARLIVTVLRRSPALTERELYLAARVLQREERWQRVMEVEITDLAIYCALRTMEGAGVVRSFRPPEGRPRTLYVLAR